MPFTTYTVPRSGQAALVFSGELLIESNGRKYGHNKERWHNLRLYRTEHGKYVLAIVYCTEWEGERNASTAFVCGTVDELKAATFLYDPVRWVIGYPTGAAFAAKQTRLLNLIRQRYEDQVSEVLMSDTAFAEKVE